jgi:hypothetical protein
VTIPVFDHRAGSFGRLIFPCRIFAFPDRLARPRLRTSFEISAMWRRYARAREDGEARGWRAHFSTAEVGLFVDDGRGLPQFSRFFGRQRQALRD